MQIKNQKIRIHFIGIGGIGMSGIAELMKKNEATLTTSVDAGSIETFKLVRKVNQYEKALSDKPRITVLNKIDALGEDERKVYKERLAKIIDEPVFMISAVSGEGIENLLRAIRIEVDKGKVPDVQEEQGSLEWHP